MDEHVKAMIFLDFDTLAMRTLKTAQPEFLYYVLRLEKKFQDTFQMQIEASEGLGSETVFTVNHE